MNGSAFASGNKLKLIGSDCVSCGCSTVVLVPMFVPVDDVAFAPVANCCLNPIDDSCFSGLRSLLGVLCDTLLSAGLLP